MTLIFKKQYIEKITSGKKTVTRRKTRPMVKVGCAYNLRINFFNHLPDRIRVERIYSQRLCEMTYQDALKGGLPPLRSSGGSGPNCTAPGTEEPVWVVEFEHLGPDRNP